MSAVRRAWVAAGAAAMMLAHGAPAVAAGPTYIDDECSASNDSYCFALQYSPYNHGEYSAMCFLTNRSITDHNGIYADNGNTNIVYVFGNYSVRPNTRSGLSNCAGLGNGERVRNNAAAASNGEPAATNTVYYSPGYTGASQAVGPRDAANLKATLRNNNASHRRTS